LSRIIYGREDKTNIPKCFPNEQLFVVRTNPWYADIVDYLVSDRILKG